MKKITRRSAHLCSIAASAVLFVAGSAQADPLKITDTQGKIRFYGDVQSRTAEVQIMITDKAGKGVNGVAVELRDPKTKQVAYRAVSKSDIATGGPLPKDSRAALGTNPPTAIDGVVTFEKVQPQTYAALVSDPNLTIGSVNVLEGAAGAGSGAAGAGAAAGSGAVAGSVGGAGAGTIGGVSAGAIGAGVVGAGVITGTAIAASESSSSGGDDSGSPQPIPSPTPTPPVDPVTPTPRPTPRPPISER